MKDTINKKPATLAERIKSLATYNPKGFSAIIAALLVALAMTIFCMASIGNADTVDRAAPAATDTIMARACSH